jgi:NADH-quinone oxidoreductase subunit E
MSFALSAAASARVDEIVARYPNAQAALLPVLHVVQRDKGFVGPEAEEWVAGWLGLSTLQVREVLSFYTLFRRRPGGRHVVRVCRNLSCAMADGAAVLRRIEEILGIRAGETTPDGKFSLVTVECLGNCDHAPCLMIDDDDHGPVTPDTAAGILGKLA